MAEKKLDAITVLLMALFMGLLMSTDAFMMPFLSKALVFFLGFVSIMAAAPMSTALTDSLADLTEDEFGLGQPDNDDQEPDGSVYMIAASIGCILFAGFLSIAQISVAPVV